MNLAAFAMVAFSRNATGSEEIADYAGLVRRSPGLDRLHGAGDVQPGRAPPLGGLSGQAAHISRLVRAKMWPLLAVVP